jgi:hypothetical protein
LVDDKHSWFISADRAAFQDSGIAPIRGREARDVGMGSSYLFTSYPPFSNISSSHRTRLCAWIFVTSFWPGSRGAAFYYYFILFYFTKLWTKETDYSFSFFCD